jgi:hypothetical protein
MMIWKGLGRKRSLPNFKVPSRHFTGGTEENHEKNLGYPASGPKFEPGTSKIRSSIVSHSTFLGCTAV